MCCVVQRSIIDRPTRCGKNFLLGSRNAKVGTAQFLRIASDRSSVGRKCINNKFDDDDNDDNPYH